MLRCFSSLSPGLFLLFFSTNFSFSLSFPVHLDAFLCMSLSVPVSMPVCLMIQPGFFLFVVYMFMSVVSFLHAFFSSTSVLKLVSCRC